jgi:hypothetical protein
MAVVVVLLSFTGCSSKPQARQEPEPSATATVPTPDESLQSADSAAPGYSLHLPPSFGRWTGDWDELAKHNMLRMLVLYNKTGFFYDKGRPRGAVPDMAEEMERYLNKKLKTRAKKFKVMFIPVSPAQLEKYLNDGSGTCRLRYRDARTRKLGLLDADHDRRNWPVTGKNSPQIAPRRSDGKGNLCQSGHSSYKLLKERAKVKGGGQARDYKGIRSQPHGRGLAGMTNVGIVPATADYRADLVGGSARHHHP